MFHHGRSPFQPFKGAVFNVRIGTPDTGNHNDIGSPHSGLDRVIKVIWGTSVYDSALDGIEEWAHREGVVLEIA